MLSWRLPVVVCLPSLSSVRSPSLTDSCTQPLRGAVAGSRRSRCTYIQQRGASPTRCTHATTAPPGNLSVVSLGIKLWCGWDYAAWREWLLTLALFQGADLGPLGALREERRGVPYEVLAGSHVKRMPGGGLTGAAGPHSNAAAQSAWATAVDRLHADQAGPTVAAAAAWLGVRPDYSV